GVRHRLLPHRIRCACTALAREAAAALASRPRRGPAAARGAAAHRAAVPSGPNTARCAGGHMRVIYTAGVWDLLHTGHIRFLQASRALGDRLIVGVVSDDGAAAYKRRPIISEHDRFAMINALSCVDIAVRQP